MPCLWSGEESFAGERGKMEEGIWISVRVEQLISASHLCGKKKNVRILTIFALSGKKEKPSRHPFARTCPNQVRNYNLEHAVQCNSGRKFSWEQHTLLPAHHAAQLQSKSFRFIFPLFPRLNLNFWRSKNKTWTSATQERHLFPLQNWGVARMWQCYFKSLWLESEWEED